jgi:isopenicillin N synthase-like dioxygenase
VDEYGNLDTVEFLNISRDDALSFPTSVHRTYPSSVEARMPGTVTPFVKASVEITRILINTLGKKLGLPDGAFEKVHSIEEHSGSETRVIRNPPVGEKGVTKDRVAVGAHTDFGSLVRIDSAVCAK